MRRPQNNRRNFIPIGYNSAAFEEQFLQTRIQVSVVSQLQLTYEYASKIMPYRHKTSLKAVYPNTLLLSRQPLAQFSELWEVLRPFRIDFPMPLAQCRTVSLRKIEDRRGNLTPIEAGGDIPFDIKRIYYLYDIPGGSSRAGHAHKNLHQLFIAMSGSFDLTLRDGEGEQRYHLNRSYYGVYVPPMIWRDIDNFSSGAVCLVLASEHYNEADYLRSYPDFLSALHKA